METGARPDGRPASPADLSTPQRLVQMTAIVEGLREIQREKGFVPKPVFEQAQAALGKSRATIYRYLSGESVPRESASFQLDGDQLQLIVACGGKVKRAWRDAERSGLHGGVSYETWLNAWNALPTWKRVSLVEGPQAAKNHQLYNPRPTSVVGERFEMDGWEPNLWVTAPNVRANARQPYRVPYVTMVIDHASRFVLGYIVRYSANELRCNLDAEHATALMVSVLGKDAVDPNRLGLDWDHSDLDADAFVFGGAPEALVVDNDRALSGNRMKALSNAAGYDLQTAYPYTGEGKGVVERLFRTMEQVLFPLAGQQHGPFEYDGSKGFAGDPVPHNLFEDVLAAAILEYNFHTEHSSVKCTPAEAWARRAHEPRDVEDRVLRPFRMVHPHNGGIRKVGKRGIELDGQYFNDPALEDLVGRRVLVRIEPGHRDWVEVWDLDDNDEEVGFIVRALNSDLLTDDDRIGIAMLRNQQRREARDIRKYATQLRQDWSADPVDDDGRLRPLSAIQADEPGRQQRRHLDDRSADLIEQLTSQAGEPESPALRVLADVVAGLDLSTHAVLQALVAAAARDAGDELPEQPTPEPEVPQRTSGSRRTRSKRAVPSIPASRGDDVLLTALPNSLKDAS